MNNTVIINSHVYTLIPYKTEEELNRLRNMCGFGPSYCKCGCGQKTKISNHTSNTAKYGEHFEYVSGHRAKGENHPRWNNGSTTTETGYHRVFDPSHPAADRHGYVLLSVVIAEKALGKRLPKNTVVHHIDGDRSNTQNNNLLVCSIGYHNYLHKRQRAYEACGHADWLKCRYCKQYDDPKNMILYKLRPNDSERGTHRRKNNSCIV